MRHHHAHRRRQSCWRCSAAAARERAFARGCMGLNCTVPPPAASSSLLSSELSARRRHPAGRGFRGGGTGAGGSGGGLGWRAGVNVTPAGGRLAGEPAGAAACALCGSGAKAAVGTANCAVAGGVAGCGGGVAGGTKTRPLRLDNSPRLWGGVTINGVATTTAGRGVARAAAPATGAAPRRLAAAFVSSFVTAARLPSVDTGTNVACAGRLPPIAASSAGGSSAMRLLDDDEAEACRRALGLSP